MSQEIRLTQRHLVPMCDAWLRLDTELSPVAVARKVGRALGVRFVDDRVSDDDVRRAFQADVFAHRFSLHASRCGECEARGGTSWMIVLEMRPLVATSPEDVAQPVYIYVADFLAALIKGATGLEFRAAIKAP